MPTSTATQLSRVSGLTELLPGHGLTSSTTDTDALSGEDLPKKAVSYRTPPQTHGMAEGLRSTRAHRDHRSRPGRFPFDSKGLFLAVVLGVGFGRLRRMVGGMEVVSVRDVRVVGGLLVIASLVVFRCLPMVVRGVLVMFGGLPVVFCCLFGHVPLLRLFCA